MHPDRYTKIVLTLIAAGLAWLCIWGPGPASFGTPAAAGTKRKPSAVSTLKARRIEIVDALGRTRILLSAERESPVIHLRDEYGKGQMLLNGGGLLADHVTLGKRGLYVGGESGPSIQVGAGDVLLWSGGGGKGPFTSIRPGNLSLADSTATTRLILGSTALTNVATGDAETRSESSLVLFDKDGMVLWDTP